MGVDPGLAKIGVAVIQQTMGQSVRLVRLDLLQTKKATKKELRHTRMVSDDQRRLRELFDGLNSIRTELNRAPVALGVEAWTPFPGKMGGNAWKTALGYQTVVVFGWSQGWNVMPFHSGDLKRCFLGKQGGTKDEVAQAMFQKVEGLEEAVQKLAKGHREHVTDAAGHAYLALVELYRIRQAAGIET